MMKTSYLDYYKLVLDKVSFNGHLFSREHKKAMKTLQPEERVCLNNWLKTRGLLINNAALGNTEVGNAGSVAA